MDDGSSNSNEVEYEMKEPDWELVFPKEAKMKEIRVWSEVATPDIDFPSLIVGIKIVCEDSEHTD
mgnify:CR=1 FL=1